MRIVEKGQGRGVDALTDLVRWDQGKERATEKAGGGTATDYILSAKIHKKIPFSWSKQGAL